MVVIVKDDQGICVAGLCWLLCCDFSSHDVFPLITRDSLSFLCAIHESCKFGVTEVLFIRRARLMQG